MSRTICTIIAAVLSAAAVADDSFFYKESKDDVSGKEVRYVGLVSEDKGFMAGGSLVLYGYADGTLRLVADPKKTIFPDTVQPEMKAEVSIRSTAMDEPTTKDWGMAYGNYDRASVTVTPDEARKLFSGESVTLEFTRTGHRVKFRTSGKGYENLSDTLEKVLAMAKP